MNTMAAEILYRKRINRNPRLSLKVLDQMKAEGSFISLKSWYCRVVEESVEACFTPVFIR